MQDFKSREYWIKKWQTVKERVTPYLRSATSRVAAATAAVKSGLYPYLRPVVDPYRRYRESHPVLARTLFYGGIVAVTGMLFILMLVLSVYLGAFGRLPSQVDLRSIDNNIASEIYSADSVLLGKYFVENRLPSDIDNISPYIIDALVATEDARFFQHGGIDLRAWARVFFRTILMQDESGGGGSTLSQQLAKNLFPRTSNYGVLNMPVAKIREMFIARRLEEVYDKNQLLALYLNKVPFGENVFGIRVAADRYFGTTPTEIKLEEAAVLVGMLKATTRYNPARHPDRALERRNVVLSQMVRYNKLDTMAYDSVSQLPLELKYNTESHDEGLATYFREHLRNELEKELEQFSKPDGSPYNIYTDGLKIYTTIDSRMQRYAEEAVREQMAKNQESFLDHFKRYSKAKPWGSDELLRKTIKSSNRYKRLEKRGLPEDEIDTLFSKPVRMTIFTWETESHEKDTLLSPLDSIKHYLTLLHTGFLAAEPQSGKIFAWVGGIDYKHFKYDHTKALRQVGSTFKPLVYAKALEQGIPPCERIENELVTYADGYEPRNAKGEYGGNYSMAGALAQSVNVVAVQLLHQVGIDNVRKLAADMGIRSEVPQELGIALGSADITLFEMVQAFSTFPNRGLVPELYYLTRVETADGEVLMERPEPDRRNFKRALSEETADVMNHMMRAVVDSGTARRLRYINNFYYPAAGKTGTTNNNTDGWFIGYGPTIITGAWVGASQPAVHWRSTRLGQGAATALPICGQFLSSVYNDPAFKSYKRKVFAPLSDDMAFELDCPDFIHPDSLRADSIRMAMESQSLDKERLIQAIREAFGKKDSGDDDSPEGLNRRENEEAERIRKKNEKLERKRERQQKRKELLEKLKEIGGG